MAGSHLLTEEATPDGKKNRKSLAIVVAAFMEYFS
jgi:hypothetical protein